MKQIQGGTRVKAGFYWRAKRWEIVPVDGPGAPLPGDENDGYYRLPALGMLIAAPVLGALFVVFLPFIGFVLVFHHIAQALLPEKRHAAGAVKAGLRRV